MLLKIGRYLIHFSFPKIGFKWFYLNWSAQQHYHAPYPYVFFRKTFTYFEEFSIRLKRAAGIQKSPQLTSFYGKLPYNNILLVGRCDVSFCFSTSSEIWLPQRQDIWLLWPSNQGQTLILVASWPLFPPSGLMNGDQPWNQEDLSWSPAPNTYWPCYQGEPLNLSVLLDLFPRL